jgi:carbon-monoxide dehydrogenase medium subunit
MKPAGFCYHQPRTLDEALALLATHGEAAKVISGGQSLVPVMNMRLAAPAELIDLNGIADLALIRPQGDQLEIGALTRHYQLVDSALLHSHCPLLPQSAQTIGHYAIRQRGTLGGSLAHADPTAQLPLVAATLAADIDIASARGRRTVKASDFFVSLMTTALAPDELVLGVRFPLAAKGEGAAFRLFNRRRGDFAIVAIAATVGLEGERIAHLRIGIGGAGPVPVSLEGLASKFVGRVANSSCIKEIASAVRATIAPEGDARISAEFRRELAETLTARALTRALERAKENS